MSATRKIIVSSGTWIDVDRKFEQVFAADSAHEPTIAYVIITLVYVLVRAPSPGETANGARKLLSSQPTNVNFHDADTSLDSQNIRNLVGAVLLTHFGSLLGALGSPGNGVDSCRGGNEGLAAVVLLREQRCPEPGRSVPATAGSLNPARSTRHIAPRNRGPGLQRRAALPTATATTPGLNGTTTRRPLETCARAQATFTVTLSTKVTPKVL